MKTYTATIKHDTGKVRLRVTASSKEAAILMICNAEGCPPRAIVNIRCN
jgi:hypothetical protein